MYKPNTTWTWAFMIAALIQAAVILSLEAFVFAKFQQSIEPNLDAIPEVKTIPTYLTLFIFGLVYQNILVYDSLRLKNTIQVIGLCIFNLAFLVYSSVQVDQISRAIVNLNNGSSSNGVAYILRPDFVWPVIRPFLIAVPCLFGVGTLVMSFIAWKLYDEFAWTIYKHISADLRMKHRFLSFQIYIALLKFDFFFFLGFTVQFLTIVTSITDAEFYCTIAAVPVTILILAMAGFWTRRENAPGMIVIIVLYVGGLAYFLFKLVRMYQPSHREQYTPVVKSLTVFAVLTIILIILTIINACWCMSNFNKGLKPFVLKRKIQHDEKIETELPDLKHGQAASRMTID